MFTGLVQALGRVAAIETQAPRAPTPETSVPSESPTRPAGPTRLVIDLGSWDHRPEPGASISVNGCCLTVVAMDGCRLAFDVIPQTLAVTSLGRLSVGSGVNLEHAATASTFLGGHVVLGHVDGLAEVVDRRTEGEWRLRLRLPDGLGLSAVDKGSITLDGVSLTIARVEDIPDAAVGCTIVDVCLIPETLARTNLAERVPGDRVNVEVDYIAKLVARQVEAYRARIAPT